MSIRTLMIASLAAPLLLGAATAARAEDAKEESPVKVSGYFGIYSDYRFRGISLNNKKFTPQGSFTVSLKPGFYVTAWGSPNDLSGGTEIDVNGGFTNSYGPITYDVGAIGYIYPNGSVYNYYEIYGSLSTSLGPFTPKVGINWAPKQDGVAAGAVAGSTKRDNFYAYVGTTAAIPDTPVTLNAQIGFEGGAFDYRPTGTKTDWQVGASIAFKGMTLSANYIDSNADAPSATVGGKDLSKGTVVVSLVYSF